MKNIRILIIIALAALAFSCSEDKGTDPPLTKETNSIQLIASEGTEITEELPTGESELLVNFHTQVKNNGPRDIKLWAKMEIVELAPYQESYYCWGNTETDEGTCYLPSTVDLLSDRTMLVKAGQTSPEANFINYLSNHNIFGGTSKIRYIVYEDGNEANRDTLLYTITVN